MYSSKINAMDKNNIESPTLRAFIIFGSSYLFGAIPVIVGLIFIARLFEILPESLEANLSDLIKIVQVCIASTIVFYLNKKYNNYFNGKKLKENVWKYLIIGAKYSIPIAIIYSVCLSIPDLRAGMMKTFFPYGFSTAKTISSLSLCLFLIWSILGAIAEELLFRGILQSRLQMMLNNALSLVLSAAIFSACHFVFIQFSIGSFLYSFFIGLVCGGAYLRSGSIFSAYLPHLVNNLSSFGYLIFMKYSI
jgi:membrane protease YdiL (CAAX protease family)